MRASKQNTPEAPLISVGGVVYGTTNAGGGPGKGTVFSLTPGGAGYGTVFSVTTAGAEAAVYTFGANPDAKFPQAPVRRSAGVIYGTTRCGGANFAGTVFTIP